MDYPGRISKHGDAMRRNLLFEVANSLLTVVRRGRKLTSHKKACVALAHKLAGSRGLRGLRPRAPFTLHRMLITGEAFHWPKKEPASQTTTRKAVPRKRKTRPCRDGGRGDPAPLVARRTLISNCALYTGRHKSKGAIMKRPGKIAGSDFADNHVAGGD